MKTTALLLRLPILTAFSSSSRTRPNLPTQLLLDMSSSSSTEEKWIADHPQQSHLAKTKLKLWPLDDSNAKLLNEVHPLYYQNPSSDTQKVYDLIAIGSGAGGLVSSKQSGRRGAQSALISEHLAGGDCLNVGCVPSKALLRAARAIREVKRSNEFGVELDASSIKVNFKTIMARLRHKRSVISPADGHSGTKSAGAHVFQGRGVFTSPNTIVVDQDVTLTFKKCVVATGGRPSVPNVPGLKEAPYTTNETLFNLERLPPRMVILGAGVIALEMAQAFASFGTQVTVLQRSKTLFASKQGDAEAAEIIQHELELSGVSFVSGSTDRVETLRTAATTDEFPLIKVTVTANGSVQELECETLLVATGRVANVESMGLEAAGIEYETGKGITIDDLSCTSNPNVYAIGDCAAGVPRLTHMSGEMAKQVVQNSLFGDNWKLSDFVVPAVAYTEPEYATVGIYSKELAEKKGMKVDCYRAGLEHNDRAILESSNVGFCKILCKAGTDEIVGCTIVADRAGEMINEVTLAMKNNLGLRAIGRNIHSYPTTGEAVMGCGLQYINSKWERLD